MRLIRSFARTLCIAVPMLGASLTFAPEAHANSGLSAVDALVNVLVAGMVTAGSDLVLTGSDIGYFALDRRPATGWAIAKIVVGAPQVFVYDGLAAYTAASSRDRGVLIFATLAGTYTGSLTANGIWSLAQDVDPLSLYGFSWAIGANTAFTSAAVGTLIGKRWPGRAFGLIEMVATAPSIAVGSIRLTDPTSERVAWGALMGWSGVLFMHGLVSALHKEKDDESASVSPASFSPRIHFGPTMVSDGIQRLPGFSVGGVF